MCNQLVNVVMDAAESAAKSSKEETKYPTQFKVSIIFIVQEIDVSDHEKHIRTWGLTGMDTER